MVMPVDSQGRPLRPSVLYGIDTRASAEIEELNGRLGREAIFEQSGSYLSANSVGPKILWFKKHQPELYERTHKVLTASSYLTFKLTGEYVMDAYSAQGYAPMFDARRRAWDAAGCAGICTVDMLPDIRRPTEIIGGVHREAAEATGLRPGTPVIAGTVDAASEAISVGVTAPGDTMLMLGSTAFITHVFDRPVRHDDFWSSPYLVDGTFALNAGLATSAAVTRWFKDQLGAHEVAVEARDGANAYALLAEGAASVPAGSGGLIVLPYFSGERAPIHDPMARGVILGLTLSHTRQHMYRAVLEGVAYSLRHNLDVMREVGARPEVFTAVGGGSKNPLWLQIIADCTGVRIDVPRQTIGASLGDAFMAALGVGLVPSYASVRDWVSIGHSVAPQGDHEETYAALYDVYRRTYPNLKAEMHDLAGFQARGASRSG
jgi:xylulokinase